jgi:hypothetical protein
VHYVCNNPVEGDIAEFGTGMGFSALTIAKTMGIYQRIFAENLRKGGMAQKTLFLFDSFEGLPAAESAIDAESPNVKSGRWGGGIQVAVGTGTVSTLFVRI